MNGTLQAQPPSLQLSFDWLLPEKPNLTVAEIAHATGMQTTFIEEYFAQRCHRYAEDERKRPPMRIPRAFAVQLLVTSAKYTAEEKLQAVASLFAEFGPRELLQLREALDARLKGTGTRRSA